MQVLQVTYADPRTGPSPSLARAVQARGGLSGTVLQNQSGGAALVETPVGRFALRLSGEARPGDVLRFSMAEGRLSAEIAPPKPAPGAAIQAPAAETGGLVRLSVSQRLTEMGAPSTESFATLARALLRAGMPLRADVLQAVHQAVGPLSADDEDALVFLLQRGIPISRETIQMLGNAQASALARVIDLLAALRADVLALMPAGEARTQAGAILAQLAGSGIAVGESAQVTAEHLARFLEESGLNMERLLGHALGPGGMSPGESALLATQNLKADLLFLQSLLGLPRPDGAGTAGQLVELATAVRQALAALETSQLSALPAANRETPLPAVLFLPIFIDEQATTLYLAVERDGGGSGRDGGGVTLTLGLELTELGPVRIILGARGKAIEVRFEVRDEATREFVAVRYDALAERLDAAGYNVLGVLAAVGRIPGLPERLPGAALGRAITGPPEGLDVRG